MIAIFTEYASVNSKWTLPSPKTWQQFGNIKRRIPYNTMRQGAGKYKANQQDRNLCPDCGSGRRGFESRHPPHVFNYLAPPSCNSRGASATFSNNWLWMLLKVRRCFLIPGSAQSTVLVGTPQDLPLSFCRHPLPLR